MIQRRTLLRSWCTCLIAAVWWQFGCGETFPETRLPSVPVSQTRSEMQDLLALIPLESTVVLSVDLETLRKSPWTGMAFKEAMLSSGESDSAEGHFIERTGMLAFVMLPALGEKVSLLVAQGRYEVEAVARLLSKTERRPVHSQYRGVTLYEQDGQSFALVGGRLLIAGPGIAVRSSLDCMQGQARSLDGAGWLERIKSESSHGFTASSMAEVASIYVALTDAARIQLAEEIGDGGTLVEAAIRVGLGEGMLVRGFGRTQSPLHAKDLAARLSHYLQEAVQRPIVDAFGFGKVLASAHFLAEGEAVHATMKVSSTDRDFIATRMAVVSQTIARMRKDRKQQEKAHP